MASAASQYATTVDTTAEMDPHYAGDEQAADYYPTPESVVHIGAHATHVTVHVHAYAPPPVPPPVPSSSVDVDVRHEPLYSYAPNPRPSSPPPPPPPPPQPTPNDADTPPAAPTPPRPTTATRSVADTLGDTLAALPDGLLSPTVRSVVQQVLRRASAPSTPRTTDDASSHTVVADVPATATRLGQRGQNVAISLMMQPLSADGSTTTSLTDLFQQLNSGPDTPAAALGVPLGDLNRHTEVVVHEPGRGLHDTCAVCQEPLEPGQVVRRVLRCGHTFHHSCLDQWLEANATCPMCMQPVVSSAVEGRAGAGDSVGLRGMSPPPPPPPPLHPPPPVHPPTPRASSRTTVSSRQGDAYSPRTTAVVQQADALLASDEEEENEDDRPSRVHVRSVEVRRIPIRLWRTTAAAHTEAETTEAEQTVAETTVSRRQRSTVVDRILESALDELTLDTIEEDGETDDSITMV